MSFPNDDGKTRRERDPWRVIVACLFELDSHEIPGIIDMSGVTVDWRLTVREDSSHKYRKAAYRHRINAAYEALDGEDKLRVAFIVFEELALGGLVEQLNAGLQRICWRIDGGTLAPATETVRELFFPQGTQHDAYVQIRAIFRRDTQSVRVIDPYMDGSIFIILGSVQGPLKVELLAANLPSDFAYENERGCWHIGCSIKDAGNRAFMLSWIEDTRNAEALLHTLHSTWESADR